MLRVRLPRQHLRREALRRRAVGGRVAVQHDARCAWRLRRCQQLLQEVAAAVARLAVLGLQPLQMKVICIRWT